jgi:hypothetical protein
MNKRNDRLTKEDYGFNQHEAELFFKINRDIPKGTFQLQWRGDIAYWYFKNSNRGKRNLKYLCKTYLGLVDEVNSFQNATKVLRERVLNDFVKKTSASTKLYNLLFEYQTALAHEKDDEEGRKDETLSSLTISAQQYQKFIVKEPILLNDVKDSRLYKLHIKSYIEDMKKRGLVRGTQRTYLKGIKRFLDWLVDEVNGKGVLQQHPLSGEVLGQLHPITQKDREKQRRTKYTPDGYMDMYQTALLNVRELWREYIKNGFQRDYRNQPLGVGTNVAYFVSMLQLGRGFRLGEILHSFRNEEAWLNRYDKKNSSSYWFKYGGEHYLYIDWKGKVSKVPVSGEYSMVRSFGEEEKPKGWEGKPSGIMSGGSVYWDTHIIDVCKKLFRESDYVFSSPNSRSSVNKPYSKTYYMNLFKQKMCNSGSGSEGWEKYDVISSHDLRDYFISEMIHKEQLQPEELSMITRHSVQTMMKYYKRDSEETQLRIVEKINMKIKSRKLINKDLE